MARPGSGTRPRRIAAGARLQPIHTAGSPPALSLMAASSQSAAGDTPRACGIRRAITCSPSCRACRPSRVTSPRHSPQCPQQGTAPRSRAITAWRCTSFRAAGSCAPSSTVHRSMRWRLQRPGEMSSAARSTARCSSRAIAAPCSRSRGLPEASMRWGSVRRPDPRNRYDAAPAGL